MANVTKTWHLAPTFDISPPPQGPIRIGSILVSKTYNDISSPLNGGSDLVPVPSSSVSNRAPQSTVHIVNRDKSNHVGFFARIAQIVGLGPEADFTWSGGESIEFSFEREHDVLADLSLETIKAIVGASTSVRTFLEETSYRKTLYVVSGIKWVDGQISMRTVRTRQRGWDAGLEADATPLGVPLGVGASGGHENKTREEHRVEGGEGFTFALRLKKLTFTRANVLKKTQADLKGAYLGVHGDDGSHGSHALGVNNQDIDMDITIEDAGADDFSDTEGVVNFADENSGQGVDMVYE